MRPTQCKWHDDGCCILRQEGDYQLCRECIDRYAAETTCPDFTTKHKDHD